MMPKFAMAVVSMFYFWLRVGHKYSVQKNHEYSQRLPLRGTSIVIDMHVVEMMHVVDYGRWWIPNLKRQIYKATYTKTKDDCVVDKQIGWYPMLNYAGVYDPMYPLMIVGATHIEHCLTLE